MIQDEEEGLLKKLLALEQRVARLELSLSKLESRRNEAINAQKARDPGPPITYIAPRLALISGERRTELRVLSPEGSTCVCLVAGWLETLWGIGGGVSVFNSKKGLGVHVHSCDEGGFVEFFSHNEPQSKSTIRLFAQTEVEFGSGVFGSDGGGVEFEPLLAGRFGFGMNSTAIGGGFSIFMAVARERFKGIDLYNTQNGMEVYFMYGVLEHELKLRW
ncbi:hypothetical protein [Chthonomonas calidirosea]|uniref:hypothetical protein n=1 Tax=Chthonomonas calidirosea TaxID=454171 RepID=UPI0006EC8D5B|nr:hypothetical protein [Chthonomonas calidirosea]CEK17101.1 hypothetical protein CP488_01736 [Chthonomonas calidirosea]